MSEKLWCPPVEHIHDLPNPFINKGCVMRCGTCGGIFQSKIFHNSHYGDYDWKERSEKWLERKLKKEARREARS